jgi:hypothetical protein
MQGMDNPNEKSSDGVTLRGRLEPLMIKIANDITECGNTCDAYSKKNVLGENDGLPLQCFIDSMSSQGTQRSYI